MFVVVDNLPASHPWPMEICIKLIFSGGGCYLLLELVTISSGKFYIIIVMLIIILPPLLPPSPLAHLYIPSLLDLTSVSSLMVLLSSILLAPV